MTDPYSIVALTASVSKVLGNAIAFLLDLRHVSRRVEDHLQNAWDHHLLLHRVYRQYNGREQRFLDEAEEFVLDILRESHEVCEQYTDLLEGISTSRMKSIEWKWREDRVKQLSKTLERRKNSLLMAMMMANFP